VCWKRPLSGTWKRNHSPSRCFASRGRNRGPGTRKSAKCVRCIRRRRRHAGSMAGRLDQIRPAPVFAARLGQTSRL
jgi:hypothetical protein